MRRLLAALLLVGCGGAEGADPCAARIDALEQRLGELAATATPETAPLGGALPASTRGVPLEGAPPLLVVTDEVLLNERGVGGIEDVEQTAETLRSDLRRWAASEGLSNQATWTVALWVAPDVPAATLARLLRHAPERARLALLVRGAPLPPLEHEPAWVASAMPAATGRPETLRERLDTAWGRATSGCPAARAQAPMPATLRPAGPLLGPPSVGGLAAALRECGCDDVDLVAVEAVARRSLVDRAGPVHRLRATLRFGPPTDDAPAEEILSNETVADLVTRIEAREGDLWLRGE
ncbi:MAG: hypothetical protein R3B82_28370 [Sandaracinaceae bacterium]